MNRATAIPNDKIPDMRVFLYGLHPRYAILFDLGIYTGLRVSDILTLRVKDCKGAFDVREKKTGKIKHVVLPVAVSMVLRDYVKATGLRANDYIVFSRNNSRSKPLSRSQAYRVIAKAAKTLRLKNISPHSMRKSYAVELFRITRDMLHVQRELNHDKLETTLLYLMSEMFNATD